VVPWVGIRRRKMGGGTVRENGARCGSVRNSISKEDLKRGTKEKPERDQEVRGGKRQGSSTGQSKNIKEVRKAALNHVRVTAMWTMKAGGRVPS